MYPGEALTRVWTIIFVAILFTKMKTWKQPKRPSMEKERISCGVCHRAILSGLKQLNKGWRIVQTQDDGAARCLQCHSFYFRWSVGKYWVHSEKGLMKGPFMEQRWKHESVLGTVRLWGASGGQYSNCLCTYGISCLHKSIHGPFLRVEFLLKEYFRSKCWQMLLSILQRLSSGYFLQQYVSVPVTSCICQYRMLSLIWNSSMWQVKTHLIGVTVHLYYYRELWSFVKIHLYFFFVK